MPLDEPTASLSNPAATDQLPSNSTDQRKEEKIPENTNDWVRLDDLGK